MSFLHELEKSFDWLIYHSLQAGVLVLLVVLVQWLFRRQLTSRWRFALWWIVLVRMLLPVGPESTLSVFNYFHPSAVLDKPAIPSSTQMPLTGAPFASDNAARTSSTSASLAHVQASPEVPSTAATQESASPLPPAKVSSIPASHRAMVRSSASFRRFLLPGAALAWLAGAIGLSLCVLVQLSQFQRRLRRSSTPADPGLRQLLDSCRREFGVTRPIKLLETEAVISPALSGVLRLRLLLPKGLSASFDRTEMRYIFLHELAHVKRGDLWLNWLVTALQILHWFNPLIWFGFARLRADRELACDELTLLRAGERVGTSYGKTVIKLLEGLSRPAAIPGLVGILEDRKQMRRRISMIANFRKPGRWSALAVLLVAGVALTALTDAQTGSGTNRRVRGAPGELDTLTSTNAAVGFDPYNMPENQPPDHAVADLPKRPDLHGRITSNNGDPLPATVFISTAGPKVGTSTFCPSCYADCAKRANTDANGDFTIHSLDPQLIFRILVVSKGYQPKFVSKIDPAKGPVEVQMEPLATDAVPPEHRVLGTVVDPTGQPVVGAVVEAQGIRTRDGGGSWGAIPGLDPLAVTDDQGEFMLASRRAFAGMDVRVEARGFAPRNFTGLAGGTSRHRLVVTEGAAITGRVLFHGKPLGDVSVGVVSVDRSAGGFDGNFDVGTGPDGRFTLVNLPPNVDYFLYGLMKTIGPYGAIPITKVRSGNDGAVLDAGDLVVEPAHRLAGRVVLADGSLVPPETRLLISRQSAWDSLQLVVGPDGSFDTAGIPAETVSLSVRVPGYRISGKNASLDPINPFQLVGRVDQDVTNLVVLLEKGKELRPDFNNGLSEGQRPENRPLHGAEIAADHSQEWLFSGRVVDKETGQPLAHFRLTPGTAEPGFGRIMWDSIHQFVGTNGNYVAYVDKRRAQPLLKVEADGYLPASATLLPQDQTNLNFALQKGSGPTGVVVLPDGKPASGASVVLLCAGDQPISFDGQGELRAWWNKNLRQTTDSQGHFAFKPELGMQSIAAASEEGFSLASVKSLATNSTIRLEPYGRIEGTLTRPSGPGTNEDVDLAFAGSFMSQPAIGLGNHDVTDSQGRFKFDHVPPGDLQISYRVKESANSWRSVPLQEVSLKPGQSLVVDIDAPARESDQLSQPGFPPAPTRIPGVEVKGVVRLPDGKPAAEAEVALQVPGQYLSLGRASFRAYQSRREGLIVNAGPDGQFALPMCERAKAVIAVHENGYARVSLDQLKADSQITLQPWGRIEGTFRISNQPVTNQLMFLNPDDADLGVSFFDFNAFQVKTDDQGRFVMTYVPPGKRTIVQLVPTGQHSWAHRLLSTVTVKPGGVTKVEVGWEGRTVIGKLAFKEPGSAIDWQHARASLHTSNLAELQSLRKMTPEERRAFVQSAEFKARMKSHRDYPVQLSPDGSFKADGIPPGKYRLSLQIVHENDALHSPAFSNILVSPQDIDVPHAPAGSEAPLNLGTCELKRFEMPELATPAAKK